MRPRAGQGARMAGEAAPGMAREMGAGRGIRRETGCRGYNPHKGEVGKAFGSAVGRGFAADGPREEAGAGVAELRRPWGEARFAPACGFGGEGIVARSTSPRPNMARRHELLDRPMAERPDGAGPALRSGMGWRRQRAGWRKGPEEAGVAQGAPRKGGRIDDGAAGQALGHVKDELFRGGKRLRSEGFKRGLDERIAHWDTKGGGLS